MVVTRVTPGRWCLFISFLKCASCRFAALYFLSFYGGLVQAGRASWRYAAFGAGFWLLQSLGIEVSNRLADRTEDAVNRPERTALCRLVGYDRLTVINFFLWVTIIAIDIVWTYVTANLLLGLLLGLSVLVSLGYSFGPRFARSRYVALVVLTSPFAGSFLIGWSLSEPVSRSSADAWRELPEVLPFVVFVGLVIVSFVGAKDITDVEGDALIGYRSVFVQLIQRNALSIIVLLSLAPFATSVLFFAAGLLPPRVMGALAFTPTSVALAACFYKARSAEERLAARDAVYHYWLVFTAVALLLFLPKPTMAVAVAGTAAYWVVTSRYLHWYDGLRPARIRLLRTVVTRPTQIGM